ncbi:MAG: YkoF family thiamine/hydroxymethylpyrimidine-binding protein [Cryomorphaceae bacterium]|nr:thiamine-binding protein [Flavobacteriales bacterium]
MKLTVEISMYPLRADYEEQVLSFIREIRSHNLDTVKVNAMSTQVVGDHNEVMEAVNKSVAKVYSGHVKASFVIKILPGQLDLDFKM